MIISTVLLLVTRVTFSVIRYLSYFASESCHSWASSDQNQNKSGYLIVEPFSYFFLAPLIGNRKSHTYNNYIYAFVDFRSGNIIYNDRLIRSCFRRDGPPMRRWRRPPAWPEWPAGYARVGVPGCRLNGRRQRHGRSVRAQQRDSSG